MTSKLRRRKASEEISTQWVYIVYLGGLAWALLYEAEDEEQRKEWAPSKMEEKWWRGETPSTNKTED